MDKINRLTVYLEAVNKSLKGSDGALREFWEREARKTQRKIESLKK